MGSFATLVKKMLSCLVVRRNRCFAALSVRLVNSSKYRDFFNLEIYMNTHINYMIIHTKLECYPFLFIYFIVIVQLESEEL